MTVRTIAAAVFGLCTAVVLLTLAGGVIMVLAEAAAGWRLPFLPCAAVPLAAVLFTPRRRVA